MNLWWRMFKPERPRSYHNDRPPVTAFLKIVALHIFTTYNWFDASNPLRLTMCSAIEGPFNRNEKQ
jgi:hypothetical protein